MSCPDDSTARPQGCGTWRDVFADALRVKTAAERLGVSPAAVDEMLRSGELVAVRMGGEWLLPVWQFSADGVLPGVRSVLRRRPGSFVSLSTWARTPSAELRDRTPAQALEDRDLIEVIATLSRQTRSRGPAHG